MKKYKLTLTGIALASIVFFTAVVFKIDLFEAVVKTFESFESYEIDEIVIPVFILFIFAFFDQIRRQRLQKIEHEKFKIYKAMISSTYDILNKFQLQMHYFKMAADNTPGFDPVVLSLYERVIENGTSQIKALGSITKIDETTIRSTVAPKLNSQIDTQHQGAAEDPELTPRYARG